MNKTTKVLLWVAGSLVVLLIAARILLPILFDWDYPYFYSHMFTPMMFPIGMFIMILFWGVIIYLVFRLLIQDRSSYFEDDLVILKRRLSNGEITIEEYEEIKKTLKEESK